MKKILFRVLAALVLLPVSLLVVGGLGYGGYAWVVLRRSDAACVAYLRTHQRVAPLDSANRATAFPDFDADFYDNQLFLLGESHGSAAPQELDFALLRHLNQKTGLRNYVAEIDPSQAYFFNRYLAAGDEADLRAVFSAWDGEAQWGNQNFYDKVRRIRALNQTLPPAARIRFIGLDRFQNLGLVGQHLRALLAQEAYVAGTSTVLDTLLRRLSAAPPTERALGRLAHRLLPTLAADSLAGVSRAGRAQVAQLLRNASYLAAPRIRRDSVMLLNLRSAYESLAPGHEKMYGLWGFYHTLQAAVDKQQPFAGLVRASSLPFHERVVSLAIFSADSKVMMPTSGIPAAVRPPTGRTVAVGWLNSAGPVVLVPGASDLLAAAPAQAAATLFRLDAPDSPYRRSLRLVNIRVPLLGQSMTATQANAATTDYFQYAVLLRNSAAVAELATPPPAPAPRAQQPE